MHRLFSGHLSIVFRLLVVVSIQLSLLTGCSTQQIVSSETMAVLDTVAWTPDGRQIAAGRNLFNIIFLYDASNLRRTAVLSGRQEDIWGRIRARSISISADGRYLAAAGVDQRVVVWDLRTNTETLRLDSLQDVKMIAFSPRDNVLAATGPENTVTLWNIPEGTQLASLKHQSEVMSLAFSADGQFLATGAADHNARIWRMSDATLVTQLLVRDYPVSSIAFSPDGTLLAVYAGAVTLWEPFKTPTELKLPKPDTGFLRFMQFAALLSSAASLSQGGGPGTYVPGGSSVAGIEAAKSVDERLPVQFSGNGRFLAIMRANQTFSGSHEILVFNRDTEKYASLRCNCFSMAFSPDSDKLISVGTKLILWDPLTGNQIAEH